MRSIPSPALLTAALALLSAQAIAIEARNVIDVEGNRRVGVVERASQRVGHEATHGALATAHETCQVDIHADLQI